MPVNHEGTSTMRTAWRVLALVVPRRGRAASALLLVALAAPATASAAYTSSLSGTTATLTGEATAEALNFDSAGGLLRHNRNTEGDAGFSSDFDFDSIAGGDQTLSASDPSVAVIAASGGGADTFKIGSPSAAAAGIAVSFTLDGQAGNDFLLIDNGADAVGRAFTFRSDLLTLTPGPAVIVPTDVEIVTATMGGGDDDLQVASSDPRITSTLNAGPGADTTVVGTAAGTYLSGVVGPIWLSGGGGTDSLHFDDSGAVDGHDYLLRTSSAQRDGGVAAFFDATFETRTLVAGPSADGIYKRGTLPFGIDAGSGADAVVTRDTVADAVTCGAGTDDVVADAADALGGDCETSDRTNGGDVRTVTTPAPPPVVQTVPGPAPQLPAPPLPTAADRVKPVVSKLKATRRGATFGLSEDARVTVTVERRSGRRFTRVTSFTIALKSGTRTVRFASRVSASKLRRGRLRVTVAATDAAGNTSARVRTTFGS